MTNMPIADSLQFDEVHIHLAHDAEIREPALIARYESLLSPAELDRRNRFHFEEHRHQFLVTRALLRTTLSRYQSQVSPGEWQFEANAYGRPRIAQPLPVPLDFNLSHTKGRIALAVTRFASPGIDIERLDRGGHLADIAPTVFTPDERADMQALPGHLQQSRFFELWTLKEAYIKAKGMGLSMPLMDFGFHITAGAAPSIRFSRTVADSPTRWQFLSSIDQDYAMALAVADAPPVQLKWLRTVPLVASDPIEITAGSHKNKETEDFG